MGKVEPRFIRYMLASWIGAEIRTERSLRITEDAESRFVIAGCKDLNFSRKTWASGQANDTRLREKIMTARILLRIVTGPTGSNKQGIRGITGGSNLTASA
jgi:hypothetical protein